MCARRNFSAEFQAKVALEALVGDKTLSELASKHDVHPNMITQWKRQAKQSLPEAFGKKASRGSTDRDAEVKELQGEQQPGGVRGQHAVYVVRAPDMQHRLLSAKLYAVKYCPSGKVHVVRSSE